MVEIQRVLRRVPGGRVVRAELVGESEESRRRDDDVIPPTTQLIHDCGVDLNAMNGEEKSALANRGPD